MLQKCFKNDSEGINATCSTGAVRVIDWMIASREASCIVQRSQAVHGAPITLHLPVIHDSYSECPPQDGYGAEMKSAQGTPTWYLAHF